MQLHAVDRKIVRFLGTCAPRIARGFAVRYQRGRTAHTFNLLVFRDCCVGDSSACRRGSLHQSTALQRSALLLAVRTRGGLIDAKSRTEIASEGAQSLIASGRRGASFAEQLGVRATQASEDAECQWTVTKEPPLLHRRSSR